MANKVALLQRLEQLEGRDVSTQDAWWREMCRRYGFPVIPIDEASREQQKAVMDAYMEEFY